LRGSTSPLTAQNKRWQEAGLAAITVAINVSARQFRQEGFLQSVASALQHSGLEPRFLELEVTESVIMHDAPEVIATLQALKAMRVQLSIDDFGTGYSSLSYLKRFPLDRLKIDQSFVRDIPQSADDSAIAQAVINLGHSLGLKVIAEGVETREQRDFLLAQGCDEMQGYLFARPVPANELEALLEAGCARAA
jgi:EAL domain-containing protein (putative c-di-GMP-specific phosphodiesterase class I)